ncbi:MAG: gliding motility-associated C-terminal domain-containing protein [Saprospiraceae bacterium]
MSFSYNNKIKAQDTIPPIIVTQARDSMLPCSNNSSILTALTNWYNAAGYATAMDDSGQHTFEGFPSLANVISNFIQSSDTLCGNTKSVVVSFTAVDPSNNRSIPTIARFYTVDETRPALIVPPNVTVTCTPDIRDTLIRWVRNKGGYIATDDCSNTLEWTRFQYSISQGNTIIQTGGGSINNGPYPTIPNGVCQWKMNINFWVKDECGNETVTFGTTSFSVIDNVAPIMINPPMDITVSCHTIPAVPQVVFLDGCTQSPDIDFSESNTRDLDSLSCGYYNYTITRTWLAEDACLNSSQHVQIITVTDTLPPILTAVENLHLLCSQFRPDSVYYTEVEDICSPIIEWNVTRTISPVTCQYSALFTYSYSDVCGNRDTFEQNITIEADPISLITAAQGTVYECQDIEDYHSLFSFWLDDRAGSKASLNCGELLSFVAVPGSYLPDDQTTWPGTHPGNFDTQMCPSPIPGYLRGEVVDFVYYDTCGHILITSAVFGLVDTVGPTIQNCPPSMVVNLPPNECEANILIPVPIPMDDCIEAVSPVVRMISAPVVSIDPTNTDSPVNPVILNIGPYNPAGVFPTSDAMITINFKRLDMDDGTEFFNIFDEDNLLLGRSPNTLSECGDINMDIILPQSRLADWLADGFITLRFEPNHVPGVPRAEINGFCGGSIQCTLSFDIDLTNSIYVGYTLDQGNEQQVLASDTLDLNVAIGAHQLTFNYVDCALNTNFCTISIFVEDVTAPTMDCPNHKSFILPNNTCSDSVFLSMDEIISLDLCGGNFVFDKKVPLTNEASLLTFIYNEISGRHVARNKQFLFDNVFPIIRRESEIKLTLEFYGNNQGAEAYFDLLAPDGTTIGSSTTLIGPDSCGLSKTTFFLDQTQFNAWIFNQQISFTAVPNNSGDGINPCTLIPPSQTTDGISYLKLRLEYSDFEYSYQLTGATTLGLTNIAQDKTSIKMPFNDGVTQVTFFTGDAEGNKGSCQFEVAMLDQTPPVAKCKNVAVNIHPSGVENTLLTATMINDGSLDACGNITMTIEPSFVNCSHVNTDVMAQLIITDEQENKDTCVALIRVKPFELMPTFSSGLCENDTLKLFANVPTTVTPGAYTYHWKGPNNFEFFIQNPTIPNVNETYNGVYSVTVTGFNQCTTEGSVIVNIQPLTKPVLTASSDHVCEGGEVILSTTQFTGMITYDWYEGIAPTGVKIATTSVPTLLLNPLNGVHFYYIIATGENCTSTPSNLLKVTIVAKPIAMISQVFYSVCEGETVTLSSTNSGNDLTYFWTGPNFTSTNKNPPPITNANITNQGLYKLVVSRGICISDTAIANVIILERPAKPIISSASVFCEGATFSLLVSNVTNGDRYEWYQNGILRFTTLENSLVIPNVQPNVEGNWTVIVFKGACSSLVSEQRAIAIDNLLQIGVTNSGPICAGDSVQLQATFVPNATYKWESPQVSQSILPIHNPKVVANAGYYSVTITTPTGCQNNAGTVVEIITPPIITALSSDATTCMDGSKPISFAPSVFPQNPNYAYQWSASTGFSSTMSNPTIVNPTQQDTGIYTLVVFHRGCPSNPFSIPVMFFMVPDKPNIVGANFYCEGDSVVLESSIELLGAHPKYLWTTPSSGQIETSTSYLELTPAMVSQSGQFSLMVEENGCRSILSNPFTLDVRKRPSLPSIQAKSPVCFGNTILLQSSFSDVQYFWSGPNLFTSNLLMPEIQNATEMNEGYYVLNVEKNGCFSNKKDSVFVEVLPNIPVPVILGQRFFLCDHESSFIEICLDPNTVVPGNTMTLVNAMTHDTLTSFTTSCILLDPKTNGLLNGSNFIYAISKMGDCFSAKSNTVVIELDSAPQFSAVTVQGDNIRICEGEPIFLEAGHGPPDVDISWTSFNPNINFSQPNEKQTTVSGLMAGTNDLFLGYSYRGCILFSMDTIQVFVVAKPVAQSDSYTIPFFQNNVFNVLENDQYTGDVFIQIITPPLSGNVTVEDGQINYLPEVTFTGEVEFTYQICSQFCPIFCSTTTVKIKVEAEKDCRPPSIITPNEDGVNDAFIVPCLYGNQFPGNSLVVFNEWGNEVFSSKNYNNDWKGMYNGNPLPTGTYYFVLDLGNGNRPLNGFLILQR